MFPSSWYNFALLAATVIAIEDSPNLPPEFDSPSATYRPKFRYWLPDAGVDHGLLAHDISDIRKFGAGGLEFIPYYNYGFGSGDISNWDVYAFGKPAFKSVFRTALEACKSNDLVMDFALGASQGQGVPVEPLTPGLAVQLVYGRTSVKGGEQFQGKLPEPVIDWRQNIGFMQPQEVFGDSRLVGVSAGAIRSTTKYSDNGDAMVALDEASMVDLSEEVVEGRLKWRAPSDHDEYIIFAFYERFTNQRSCVGIPTDVIANGSWVTDHYSAAGTKLVTRFWEKNLLNTEIRDLLKSVGEHSWEDSMEIQASLYWTPDYIERFTAGRGYNPVKYLPLMFHQSNSFHGYEAPYNTTFYLEGEGYGDQGKYLQDYRLTLTEGYNEYLEALESWAQSLGVSHSCQVAYNQPVDLSASVPLVSGPELESLGFVNVDQMLQFVGPAHLGGRNMISTEVGAVPSGAYSLTLPSFIRLFHDAFAGGVNMMLMHGMPYSGDQLNSTWPGYTPFQYRFTDPWGPRQPAWNYIAESLNYTGRNQFILQSGVAKRELAFYLCKDPWRISTVQDGDYLRQSGLTYEYLGPANWNDERAIVSDGVLAWSGPGYRALVFDHQSCITEEAADKLVKLAKEELPIIIIGDLPNSTIGTSGQETVLKRMADLKSAARSNVKFIRDSSSLTRTLDDLAVKSRVSVRSSVPSSAAKNLYTLWRSDESIDYVFFHNSGPSAAYNISMEAEENRVTYKLNAWTGVQEPIAVYGRSPTGVSMQVTLQSNQTAIIALAAGTAHNRVISHSENVFQVSYDSANKFVVLLDDTRAASLALSNGRERNIPAMTKDTKALVYEKEVGPWDLTIESWVPSSNFSSSQSAKEKLPLGPQATLLPWSEIPEVQNVSGVGIYTAKFSVPTSSQLAKGQVAIRIHFGPVLNTLRAWVNGKQLPPVDIFDAELDISDYLKPGNNIIRVETSSTLFNAVKARSHVIKTNGGGPLDPEMYDSASWQPHGLVGPVRIKSLRKVTL
ncbi:hypothetical protein B0T10DRAFT_412921 [Thelonectria olida]|uniref:Secreted protein n=1 Tax=Thelonectria olida TaxID=1576542 RepID=A0A9P8VVB1_9HYPO|nr:hypothetical protein B0T10DRAFT_412921 [Thelonectria olida]